MCVSQSKIGAVVAAPPPVGSPSSAPVASTGPSPRPVSILAGSGPGGVVGGAGITGSGSTCGGGSATCTCLPGFEGALPAPANPNLDSQTYCSSGGACLAGDERVEMADGSCKVAEEIAVGDMLATRLEDGTVGAEKVVATFGRIDRIVRILHERGELRCSASHRLVMEDGADRAVCEIDLRDRIRTADGGLTRVEAILETEPEEVFGWTCEPTHTFLASGLLHHNKISIGSKSLFGL